MYTIPRLSSPILFSSILSRADSRKNSAPFYPITKDANMCNYGIISSLQKCILENKNLSTRIESSSIHKRKNKREFSHVVCVVVL